jgi:hypothetical protein
MTCHRKYTFLFENPLTDEQLHNIDLELSRECERLAWYTEPSLEPERLTFHVAGRDQWWAHRRAMNLVEHLVYTWQLSIPVPVWEPYIPPHENRGYSRLRK